MLKTNSISNYSKFKEELLNCENWSFTNYKVYETKEESKPLTLAALLFISNDGRCLTNREIKTNVAAANEAVRHKDS